MEIVVPTITSKRPLNSFAVLYSDGKADAPGTWWSALCDVDTMRNQ